MQPIEKNQEVYEFIKNHACGVLATVSETGVPDVAHVFVFLDLAFNGYFVSKIETRKISNIMDRPYTVVLFSDTGSMQQVEYRAKTEIITEPDEIVKILERVLTTAKDKRAEDWIPPMVQVPGEGYAVIKLVPEKVLYRDYSREEKDTLPREFEVKL